MCRYGRSKSTFLLLQGACSVLELQSSWLSQLIPSHSTFQNIICTNLQCNADFWVHLLGETKPSQGAGWVSHYLHNNGSNDGRWQIPNLSQEEGHSPRNTSVPNVTSGKDSPLIQSGHNNLINTCCCLKLLNLSFGICDIWVLLLNNQGAGEG